MSDPSPSSRVPGPASIRLLNWGRYLSAETLEGFEAECGIRVDETTINSNEEFIRRISAGERYDVIIPEDWAAEVLIDAGLLQPLDMELLPNWEHVTQPYFQSPPYDARADGHKYTSIFCFGTEGFAVRLDQIAMPKKSWQMLYDPEYAGRSPCSTARARCSVRRSSCWPPTRTRPTRRCSTRRRRWPWRSGRW